MNFSRRRALTELRNVPEIYVPRDIVEEARPFLLIEEVGNYVDRMVGWFYRREELAKEAVQSAAVSAFVRQVMNGGGSLFVMGGKWEPALVGHVRSGLRELGAVGVLEWFEWLAGEVEDRRTELPRFLLSRGVDNPGMREKLDRRNAELLALNRATPIEEMHRAYLRSLPNLRPLDGPAFEDKMFELVESVPDFERRSAERIHLGPQQSRMANLLYRRVDQRFHRYVSIGRVVDTARKISANTVKLTRGTYDLHLAPDSVELREIDGGRIVASITTREFDRARAGSVY